MCYMACFTGRYDLTSNLLSFTEITSDKPKLLSGLWDHSLLLTVSHPLPSFNFFIVALPPFLLGPPEFLMNLLHLPPLLLPPLPHPRLLHLLHRMVHGLQPALMMHRLKETSKAESLRRTQ